MNRRNGTILAIVLAAFLIAGLLSPYRHGHFAQVADTELVVSDFGAFYCAALAHREGSNPYLFDPMKDCEVARVYGPGGGTFQQHGLDPAPLPPYSLALFAPFTYLPYRVAGLLWLALLVAATFAGALALTRLTGHAYWVTLAFLGMAAQDAFTFGQPQPLLSLALIVSALLVRAGRHAWAAVALVPTLIDPHVGIAPLLGMLVWSRARLTVLGILAAAAALSLAYGGLDLNLEYLTKVLPITAFSELPTPFEFSLSALLSALGASDDWALRAGALEYAALLLAAVVAAGPLSRRIGSPAIVLLPAAAAVFGGVYIHLTQLASALPLAFYLVATVPSRALFAWTGAALITLPWFAGIGSSATIPAKLAILYSAVAGSLAGRARNLQTATAAAVIVLYFASGLLMRHVPFTQLHPLEPAGVALDRHYDPRLAATQEAIENREAGAPNGATIHDLAWRVPPWTGLALILAVAFSVPRRPTEPAEPPPAAA